MMPIVAASCISEAITIAAPSSEFDFISTGRQHACGITPVRTVLCWGAVDPRPTLVSSGFQFSVMSTRGDHTCGITSSGAAFCWGFNAFGQLGTARELQRCVIRGSRVAFFCSGEPVEVETDVLFQTLGVGSQHTCGLDLAGFAYCWGANISGELGAVSDSVCVFGLVEGGLPCSADPLRVDGDFVFQSLSVGSAHACGVTAAGNGYCWGVNEFGRLGDGTLENRSQPTPVAGNHTFSSISAGGSHTCGVTADDQAYCWGSNSDLQLGAVITDRSLDCGKIPLRCVTTPVAVSGNLRFQSVTASHAVPFAGAGPNVGGHTCGLTTGGETYCWGLNEFGELRIASELRSATPILISVGHAFTQLSAGQLNTCGLTTESTVVCWAFGSPLSQWVVPAR